MHRVIVILLSALDTAIQAAVGLAVVAAPLTVLWVFGLGGIADWGALWPASATVWQLGNLVPLAISLPAELLVRTGLPTDAATFGLSLAPLAFAGFTVIFGARSGSRAARAGAWGTGVLTAAIASAAAAGAIALTARTEFAETSLWQAIVIPSALYTGAVLVGALVEAWRGGDDGIVDRVHDRVDALHGAWSAVPAAAVRGAAVAVAGLVGAASVVLAAAIIARGGHIIALFQAGNVDVLGATIVMLGQLAYLPTLVVWSLSWIVGPGFAVGAATSVSPAGTQLGVAPGIPVLGAIPELSSAWWLLVLLIPVFVGVAAGWMARTALVRATDAAAARVLVGPGAHADEAVLPRMVTAVAIAVLAAAAAAALAVAGSGSLGPGRLAEVGPHAGQVALAVGIEVLVGAAILLLSPRSRSMRSRDRRADDDETAAGPEPETGDRSEAGYGSVAIDAGEAAAARDRRDVLGDEPWAPAPASAPASASVGERSSKKRAAKKPAAPAPEPESEAAATPVIPLSEQETAPIEPLER